jgi:acetylornithine deacetylase
MLRARATRQEFADLALVDPSERTVVVGRRHGAGGGRSLLCFAHPDSEPVVGTERWTHAPFAAEIVGGRMYGWGVADDLLGVATMLAALEALAWTGVQLAGDVLIASTPSKRRTQGIVAALERGYRADGCLYLHPAESGAGLGEIKALVSGVLCFRIIITGRAPDTTEPGHTAFAHLAVNPIDKAWGVYEALRRLDAERGRMVRHPLLDQAVGRSTNLLLASIRGGDEAALARVSTECALAGTITFPPGETMADVQAQVERAVATAAASDPWLHDNPPAVEWISGTASAEVGERHPLYQTVRDAIAVVTGQTPYLNPLHSGSDIRNPMVHAGIPTVGIGSLAGDLSQNGKHDEWVDIADYLRAVEATALTMAAWCGAAWNTER